MKKLSAWGVAIITGLVSLAAMLIFDFILSVIYYFIGKVPLLSDVVDYIGDILDLGLTALIAMGIALFIWRFGYGITNKITGENREYDKSPVAYTNFCFIIVFLVMVLFLGYQFVTTVGRTVANYTTGYEGFDKLLLFLKAIKDHYTSVCGENIVLYKLGNNSLILWVINALASRPP